MDEDRMSQLSKKVNYFGTALLAIGVFAVGGLLLWVSEKVEASGSLQWAAVWSQVGGVLVATGALTLLWEWFGRNALLGEVLAHIGLKNDLVEVGIASADDRFHEFVDWDQFFRDARELDIVFAYGDTWRGTQRKRLKEMAARKGTRIRVFLPDPDDARFMQNLEVRFGGPADEIATKIRTTAEIFADLERHAESTVEVFYRPGDQVLSYYLFGDRAVMALYSHSFERLDAVPTFTLVEGKLLRFLRADLAAIESVARPR